jgi:ergothioneine biosynthesis protein EgtB
MKHAPLTLVDTTPQTSPLAVRFKAVREATLALVNGLSEADCQVQSMPDASPAKWHLAHTTWFFETFLLERFEPGFLPFDPHFKVLFNSYYQGVGEQHPRQQRGLVTRPGLDEVKAYRREVEARMLSLLANEAAHPGLRELVTLGLHHEQQHQELMQTDLKHLLSLNPLHPGLQAAAVGPEPTRSGPAWAAFEGGLVDIGFDAKADGDFCFDNECPRHRVWLEPFQVATQPVSQGDYLAFMEDGGYRRPELWLSIGWDWVRQGQRRAPLYWRQAEGQWFTHTLQGETTVDLTAPACHLSHFEADAYARWADARLPTEAEWEHAARQAPGNVLQQLGAVWEWTQSSYSAYPGYRPLPGAVGEYNGKFMCSQYVLRGSSVATPAGHSRMSYRNFFPPDAQWQFSGVRLAR